MYNHLKGKGGASPCAGRVGGPLMPFVTSPGLGVERTDTDVILAEPGFFCTVWEFFKRKQTNCHVVQEEYRRQTCGPGAVGPGEAVRPRWDCLETPRQSR